MEEENTENIKQAIKDTYNDKHWEDWKSFTGFKSEEEKTVFFYGVKYGIEHALFWIAEYFGEVNFWEGICEKREEK